MEMEIISKSLPPSIRHKVEKLREAEVRALTAEAAAQRALASRQTEQMELVQIKKEAEEERLNLLKEKRRKQEEILLSQMRPEISQMQEAMERITASTTMLQMRSSGQQKMEPRYLQPFPNPGIRALSAYGNSRHPIPG
jgi:hypothetical protein